MKTALGKGLGALLPEGGGTEVTEIELRRIAANAEQPRKYFNDEALKELAASIKEKGVIQPVLVKRQSDGSFMLIAGERRYRAAHIAGLKKLPAIVRDADEEEIQEIALIENLQREDLNPMETARAFKNLQDRFGLSQEELAKKVGKERATVANYLRLLGLQRAVGQMLDNGEITMGHAKALLSIDDEAAQVKAAKKIVAEGLSVREAEVLAKSSKAKVEKEKRNEPAPPRDPNEKALEQKLVKSLGTKVRLKHKGKGGVMEIEYYSLEELDRILELLL
jgi:ParB family chromosome partitioning protein